MKGCKETMIWKVIGITEDRTVICVDRKFQYAGGMAGYTGSRYDAISHDEVKRCNTLAYAKEYLCEAIGETEIKSRCGSILKGAKIFLAEKDGLYVGHDASYLNQYGTDLERIGKEHKDIFGFIPETFNCCGGGRMFGGDSSINEDTKWAVLLEPKLLAKILKFENEQAKIN